MTRIRTKELREEIQALRAVAVLLVLLFHLWPHRMPGGYIGVDVFFVISGFLITGHLWREVERKERVNLPQFWSRRARRLLPSAYLVLSVTALAVVAFLPYAQWRQNFREIIGSALYVENWVLAFDAVDYLAADNDPSAVQHYWTLAVEEQFYLVWPLLVILALAIARFSQLSRRSAVLLVLSTATITSFGYSLWITENQPAWAYFSTLARAWQFGAGALLAMVFSNARSASWGDRTRSLLSWAGFFSLAVCAFAYSAATPFPGTAALVPVVATLAVIAAGAPISRISPAPLMRWRLTRELGEISYAAYLWHWPLIIITPWVIGTELTTTIKVLLLVLTLALAWMSTHWFENPFRFGQRSLNARPRTIGVIAASGALVLSGSSLIALNHAQGLEEEAVTAAARITQDSPDCFGAASMDPLHHCENPELATMLVPSGAAVARDIANPPGCWNKDESAELLDCSFGGDDKQSRPHVVLVGDSHARALLPAFLQLVDSGDITLTAHLKGGCPLSAAATNEVNVPVRHESCALWKARLSEWLIKNANDIDVVITTGYAKNLAGDSAARARDLADAWQPIADAGIQIVGSSDNPRHSFKPANCLESKDSWDETTCAIRRIDAFPYGDPFGDAAALVDGADTMDLTDFYCNLTWCPSVIGGVNVYRDNHHVTATWSRTLAPYILRNLKSLGMVSPH